MWHALPPCPPDGCDEAGGEAVLCKTQQQAALAHACSSGRGREEMRLERGLWAAGSDASSQATAPTAVADEQQLYQVVIVLPLGHPVSAMRECGQVCERREAAAAAAGGGPVGDAAAALAHLYSASPRCDRCTAQLPGPLLASSANQVGARQFRCGWHAPCAAGNDLVQQAASGGR